MYMYLFYLLVTFACYKILNAAEASDFLQMLEKLGVNVVYKAIRNARTYHKTEFPNRMYSLVFDRKVCYKWATTLSSVIIYFYCDSTAREFVLEIAAFNVLLRPFLEAVISVQRFIIWVIPLVNNNLRAYLHCTAGADLVQVTLAHKTK